jgi:hypothetical protein
MGGPGSVQGGLMELDLKTKRHQIIVRLKSREDDTEVSRQARDEFLDILAGMVADAYLSGQSLDQAA